MSDLRLQQIDQFYITDLIAQGGMAEVYLAQDVTLKRQVALKVLSPQMSTNRNATARFQREAETVAKLSHPYIVQIYSTGRTPDKRPFLAMEYISGGSLERYLAHLAKQNHRLTTEDSLRITRQVAEALVVAHQAGIIHRDLKPSNILLRQDGTPVVTDLGIAAVQTEPSLTQTGKVVGTPHYMSPEQAKGQSIDGRSDIYSLGMILYEMLAGKVPFSGDSPLSILHQQVSEPPPPLDTIRADLSKSTCQAVEICLQKDPANRFQTAADLLVALDHALLAEKGELPPPSTVAEPAIEEAEKRPLWLFGVLLLILLFLCAGGFFLLRGLIPGLAEIDSVSTVPPAPTLIVNASPTATKAVLPQETAVPVASANVVASKLAVPPTIDGNLDDWSDLTPYLSTHTVYSAPGWDGSADLSVAWKLGWDDQHLYVGATVIDDVHVQTQRGNQIFKGDNLDLQIDIDQAGDWGSGLNTDDYQINLSPGNFTSLPPSAFRFTATTAGDSIDAPGHSIRVAAQAQPDGYTLEAAIPWQDINVVPTVGLRLGTALNATDNDTPGTAVQEQFLSNSATRKWDDPTSWGTLTLAD